jgi:hypothetical protein
MRQHYSTVRLDEKRRAMEAVGKELRAGKVRNEVRNAQSQEKGHDPHQEKAA